MPRSRAPWARWVPSRYAGSIMQGGGRKIVLHTMECGSESQPCWPGYDNWGSTPHLSVHPGSGQARQHVNFNRSARALASPGHPRSPNSSTFAIQIEIVGRAHDTPRYSDAWYRQLAEWLDWLCDEWDIPKRFPFDFGEAGTAGRNGRNRVSWDQYYRASGIVGHQNVPFNDHWDPGNLNQAKLLHYMGASGGASQQPKEWDEMASKDEIRAVVREEVERFADHGITVTKPDGKRAQMPLYAILSTVYGAVTVPVDVDYGEEGEKRPLRFVIASTQHRVRELTRAVFGTPDIEEGAEAKPTWLADNG